MMRQKSMSTFGEPLKVKTHLKSNSSLKKIEPNHTTKILHADVVKKPSCLKQISRQKQMKADSKISSQKDKSSVQPNTKAKIQAGVKTNVEAIHIKRDLKHLITKMNANREKKVEVAGCTSRNTQKHIKSTKNSNQKEPKQPKRPKQSKQKKIGDKIKSQKPSIIGNKRCSYQQTLQTVHEKITISRNRTHNSHDDQPKVKKQQMKPMKLLTHGNTRYSLDSNPIGVKKAQIQQSLKIKPSSKVGNVACNPLRGDKNFMQIFKQYKKSFDVENIKVEKSQKHDSLNTSQSRRLSFLNSDRYVTAPLSLDMQRQKLTRPLNGKVQQGNELHVAGESHDWQINSQGSQVETIMREAISQIQQYKQCSQDCRVDTGNAEEQGLFGRSNLKFKKTIEIVNPKKPAFLETVVELKKDVFGLEQEIRQQRQLYKGQMDAVGEFKLMREEQMSKDEQVVMEQNGDCRNGLSHKFQQREMLNEKESIEQSTLIPTGKEKDFEPDRNPHREEQHFKSSKYYVQPIPFPLFKKATKLKSIEDQQLDVSLLGCEITLIQNNIIEDQGELAELQL